MTRQRAHAFPILGQVLLDDISKRWKMRSKPRILFLGLLDWVLARQSDGAWLIEIMHNTDLTNYPAQGK